MAQFFLATFKNGVLRPHQPLSLPPSCQVRVTVEVLADDDAATQSQDAWKTVEKLWQRSAIDSGGERVTREQLHERR
jgi:predicted DNA-binding antitoxin AbrB/MazE fold protein